VKTCSIILILWITSTSANALQGPVNVYEPQALALVAKHEVEQMQAASDSFFCLSLPKHKDPSRVILKKINGQDLHLRRGSDCWKTPKGFLLLINSYDKTGADSVKIIIELDDMNLNNAHVVTRLRQSTYELQLTKQGWEIKSFEMKSL